MMLDKFKWLIDPSKNDVRPDLGNDITRRIVFSNILFISLPVVYFIFMVIDYKTYLVPLNHLRFDQFIVPIIILICFLCLWLNRINQNRISRNLFLAAWPFLLHIIPIKLLASPPDYFLAFPFGLVFHSIMIQLMLSYKNQPIQFWSWMIANLLTILFAPTILLESDSYHRIPPSLISGPYYILDSILYWLLFNLVVFYTIIELERYIKYVHTSKALIEDQKEELTSLNQNLEAVVLQRTRALEEQNQKLKDYAFYNAHTLRGPFCRVKGLVHLRELVKIDGREAEEINTRLLQSLEELDQKIQDIQLIVQNEGEQKSNEIDPLNLIS